MDTVEIMERALQHVAANQPQQAEDLCRQVLAQEADNPDAHYVLALIAGSRGDHAEALRLLDRAVAIDAEPFWFHLARGQTLKAVGNVNGAIDAYAQTLALQPDSLQACSARAVLLGQSNRFDEAIDEHRRWIALDANNITARAKLAMMLLARNRTAEAGEAALAAVQLAPNDAAAQFALARVFESIANVDKAIEHYEKSAALDSRDAESRHRLALMYSRVGEMDRAMALWREAIALAPNWRVPHDALVQNLNYDPNLSPQEIFEEHRRWAEKHAEPLTRASAGQCFGNPRDPDRPLRVGYISPDFTNHPIAAFIRPILQSHDRRRFHAVCFSDVAKPGAHTEDLKSLAGAWISIVGQSDEQVVQMIRAQEIDVLVDLTGQLANNRLMVFARRAAPVQISYLGYCNTTGMSAMDWIILDEITDPPDRTQPYTEKILRLPHGFSCYAPKSGAADVNDLPAQSNHFVTLACFHRPKKLNDAEFDLFARVLQEVPNSRILFWRNILFGRAAERVRAKMRERGVSDDRFIVKNDKPPTATHLGMYHAVDISLDTQPWSGHTTSCESTWMGVPYVTMRGKSHAGRMTASAMTHAGAAEFVANDREEFVDIVKQLASDLLRLCELRRSLRDRMSHSDLCDAKQFTTEFEQAIRVAWKHWCDRSPSQT